MSKNINVSDKVYEYLLKECSERSIKKGKKYSMNKVLEEVLFKNGEE